jgi:putative ABC transport system permease protein
MLNEIFKDQLTLGIFQAVVTVVLALAVTLVGRWWKIHLEKEVIIALVRGIVQIVIVALVLVALLKGPGLVAIPVLIGMIITASVIAGRRVKGVAGSIWVSFYAIGFGAGLVILLMVLAGVIDPALTSVIPVGSMLIANSMNTCAQALERFASDVKAHTGQVEAGLALGAAPGEIVTPYSQLAVHSSLIPRIDQLSSLGIVWIPGLMSGMLVAGTDPVYAAIYQFSVITMMFASSGLTSVVGVLLVQRRVFTPAQQLLLRPGNPAPPPKKSWPA